MRLLTIGALWLCALAAAAAEPRHTDDTGSRVVAYVRGGSIPAVIHARKLTHVNVSFARIDAGRVVLDQPGVAADLAKLYAC